MENSGKISAMAVALGASILIILILVIVPTPMTKITQNTAATPTTQVTQYTGVKREFTMFNDDIPTINETALGMPHDSFSIPTITVMKGDMIVIHFYNVEDVDPDSDSHSFTIWDKHYNINVVVKPGENKTITFNATTSGVFPYICTFHQPTMTGQLVVLEPTS